MPIRVPDEIVPNGDFGVVQDTFLKGGCRAVANLTAMGLIPPLRQRVGMLVMVTDTRDVYTLVTQAVTPIPIANWRLLFRATGTSSAGVPRGRIQLDELGAATSTDNPPDDHAKVSLREMRALRLSMLSTDGNSCSRVLTGCALTPIFGATYPLGRLNPGTILLPNDIVAMIDELDVNLGLLSGYVEAAVPGAYPDNVYVFVRQKAGESFATLRASVTPPTYLGRLGVTPAGAEGVTYATSDYGYVGMLRPIAATGGSHDAVWGGFAVSHYGNGVRKLVFGDAGNLAPVKPVPLYVVTVSGVGGVGVGGTVNQPLLSGPIATEFPTCFQVDAFVHSQMAPGVTNGDYSGFLRGHGAWMFAFVSRSAGHLNTCQQCQVITLAKTGDTLQVAAQAAANPAASQFTTATWVQAMYENVNQPDVDSITFGAP